MTGRRARACVCAVLLAGLAASGALLVLKPGSGSDDELARGASGPLPRQAPVAGPGRLAGYVRDVNDYPLPGARVSVVGGARGVRVDSLGRYELRLPGGEATVVAEDPGHATQHVTLTTRPAGGRLDFSLAVTEPDPAAANSADRLIFWARCEGVAALGKKELDRWIDLGVDGFVCSTGHLSSMGGEQAFSGNRGEDLGGDAYRLQRTLSGSAAVRKARAGELRLYLGFFAVNAQNQQTPLEEWFDDEAWSGELLPVATELASAVRSLGFAGVAIDQELYPVFGETQPTWSWDYPDNQHSEEEVRAKVRQRGSELMSALLAGHPGLELVAYDTQLPETWSEKVQEVVNHRPDQFAADVRIDLWDGLSSVPGYTAIRWFDAIFYKIPHLSEDWATGLQYNANRVYSLLSRRFSNWSYASSRLHLSPFSWVDEGASEFEAARSPEYVEEQLTAFREWGMGGMFGNYDHEALDDFDYEPYREALRQASTPEVVDRRPPDLSVGTPAVGDGLELSGTATSDLAIRAVRWYDDLGRFGTAELDWEVESGNIRSGWDWTMNWRLEGVPAPPGGIRLTIVAEDIKGLATARTLTVTP